MKENTGKLYVVKNFFLEYIKLLQLSKDKGYE